MSTAIIVLVVLSALEVLILYALIALDTPLSPAVQRALNSPLGVIAVVVSVLAAFLLIVDLVFLPWHKVSTVRFGQAISGTATGIQFPNSVYGLLAVLLAAVMLGQVLFHLLDATLPDVGVPWPKIQRIVGPTVLVLLLVKLLVETRYLSIGAFLAVVLGGALAWGASVSSPGPVRHA